MVFKGSDRGPIAGRTRYGESDTVTRDKRSNKLADISILPARRTIVNVYQLIGKLSERKGEKVKSKVGKGEKSSPLSGKTTKAKGPRGTIYHLEKPDSRVYVKDLDGVPVNIYNLPVYNPEVKTDIYNSNAYRFIRDYMKRHPDSHIFDDYVKPKTSTQEISKSFAAKKEESGKKESVTDEEIRLHKREISMKAGKLEKELLKKQHEKDPLWKLWRSVREKKIPIINSQGQLDPRISYSEISDPTEDYTIVEDAIIKSAMLPKDQPPLVIALQPVASQPPRTYYIRNISLRKKKSSYSFIKRPVIKLRASKKRKVVMRNKGGKK